MKKFWFLIAAMVAVSSCAESPEEVVEEQQQEETTGIALTTTITMSQEEDIDTKVSSDYGSADVDTWKFTWDEADMSGKVYALCKYNSYNYKFVELTSDSITDGDATAEFTGTLPEGTTQYQIIYADSDIRWESNFTNAEASLTEIENESDVIVKISSQNGDLDNLLMVSTIITVDGEETITSSPYLSHAGGFVALGLDFDNVPESWDGVTVSKVEIAGFDEWGGLTFMQDWQDLGFDINSSSVESITVTPESEIALSSDSDNEATLYFNIFETSWSESKSLEFTITFSNDMQLVVTKENLSGETVTFSRATFNDTTINYDFSDGSVSGSDYFPTTAELLYSSYVFNGVAFGAAADDCYEIGSTEDLTALASLANSGLLETYTDCTFDLTGDITIGENWTPIGTTTDSAFKGTFNGNGYTISGVAGANTCELDDIISIGLFGYVEGESTVVNGLVVDNYTFKLDYDNSGTHAGILVGTLQDGAALINCGCGSSTKVELTKKGAIGGLVGLAKGSSMIYNCYNQGEVVSSDTADHSVNIGGLCGSASSIYIGNCYNSGDVTYIPSADTTGDYLKGALIGENSSVTYDGYLYYRADCANHIDSFTGDEVTFYAVGSSSSGSADKAYTNSMSQADMMSDASGGLLDLLNLYDTNIYAIMFANTGITGYPWKLESVGTTYPTFDITTVE